LKIKVNPLKRIDIKPVGMSEVNKLLKCETSLIMLQLSKTLKIDEKFFHKSYLEVSNESFDGFDVLNLRKLKRHRIKTGFLS
jgi:hypothetical protein